MSSESCIQLASPVTLVTTGETTVMAGPVIPEANPGGQGIRVSGYVNVTTGTATTTVTIRVHAGPSVSAPLVGRAAVHTLPAGETNSIPFEAVDPTLFNPAGPFPPGSGGAQYSVSVQQQAATGNGTVNDATLGQTPITAAVG